jgi:hypothetical protein
MSVWIHEEDRGIFTTWNFEKLPNVGDKITHQHLVLIVESIEWDNSNHNTYINVHRLE